MQKEILTLADCKARLLKEKEVSAKEERLATLFWIGFTLVVSLIWGLLLCLPLKLISGEIPIFVYLLLGVLCAIPPVVLLHIWFVQRPKERKQYLYSVKNGIEIVEDTL